MPKELVTEPVKIYRRSLLYRRKKRTPLTAVGTPIPCEMFGGGGLRSMAFCYLHYGLPHSLRDAFLASIDRFFDETVDVHVGDHLGGNSHSDKLARVKIP